MLLRKRLSKSRLSKSNALAHGTIGWVLCAIGGLSMRVAASHMDFIETWRLFSVSIMALMLVLSGIGCISYATMICKARESPFSYLALLADELGSDDDEEEAEVFGDCSDEMDSLSRQFLDENISPHWRDLLDGKWEEFETLNAMRRMSQR